MEKSLMQLKSMGKKSVDEILEVLSKIGLSEKKEKRTNIKNTRIPKNIQQILISNDIGFVEDIPKDIKILLKMKGMGRVKINKLLAAMEV